MKTTILTVMLAASVMGAEAQTYRDFILTQRAATREQARKECEDQIRKLAREEFHKLRAEESQQMMLSFKTNNFTLCGGYPGQSDVVLTNISAESVTNLNADLLNGDLPKTPRIGIVTNILAEDIIPASLATNIVLSAEQVEQVCASGQICNVKGHWWVQLPITTLAYYPDGPPAVRKCRLCGKSQTRVEEWRD